MFDGAIEELDPSDPLPVHLIVGSQVGMQDGLTQDLLVRIAPVGNLNDLVREREPKFEELPDLVLGRSTLRLHGAGNELFEVVDGDVVARDQQCLCGAILGLVMLGPIWGRRYSSAHDAKARLIEDLLWEIRTSPVIGKQRRLEHDAISALRLGKIRDLRR
jgi:hypothetical protein